MSLVLLATLLYGAGPPPQYDLWIADPAWVKEPAFREWMDSSFVEPLNTIKGGIRGLTEKGEIFHVDPSGYWSKGSFRPLRLNGLDPGTPTNIGTFLLRDGRITTGGEGMLNDFHAGSNFAKGVDQGGILTHGQGASFTDRCIVTAASPSGKFAGLLHTGDTDPRVLGQIGFPCRIVDGKAQRLPMPKNFKSLVLRPNVVSEAGIVLAETTDDVAWSMPMSVVWMPDNRLWTTRERFKLAGKSIVFNCVDGRGWFAGAKCSIASLSGDTEQIELPIVWDGKRLVDLPMPANGKRATVLDFFQGGYLGWVADKGTFYGPMNGCLWKGGKAYRLRSLVKGFPDWEIGTVGAFNSKGQLAVNLRSKSLKNKAGEPVWRIGVLTPRP
ncbi:MAG: hypothetical protein JST35_00175 [Armatimonadetes bacterium]|nr:hypothetical protein [Armatimonadota bacterium]